MYTKPVGAGLLAKAVCQVASMSSDTPPSRASPLPQKSYPNRAAMVVAGLAREEMLVELVVYACVD